tara:strand:- start:322288 stop:334170 length:11883 start_codon:yes stop_codon:yes gene_type:complete
MRPFLTCLIGIFFSVFSQAQTNVSGNITSNTTWTKANSPYVLIGDVGVGTGITLTLEPGVTVKRSGNVQVLIKGAINAQGTSLDSISFEDGFVSQSSESKFFLSFQETNLSNSVLDYLSVKSTASTYDVRTLFIRVSKETEHNQAPIKVTGTLTVSNSRFLGNYLATDGFQTTGKLIIDRSELKYSTVYGALRGEAIEIRNSISENSKVYSGSYNAGILIENGRYESTEFLIGCCGANLEFQSVTLLNSEVKEGDGNPKAGPIRVTNSKFINSPIHLPSAYLIADKSVFFVDKNIKDGASGITYIVAPIRVGRINMTDSYVNGDGGTWAIHVSGFDGYNVTGESKILNSTLVNYDGGKTNGVLGLADFGSFIVNNTNFYSFPKGAITNLSAKSVNAQTNYYDQYNTLEEIEEAIYHYNDFISYGLVDYSGFLNTPAPSSLLLPPLTGVKRKYENGQYIDKVSLSFRNVDNVTSDLKVYSTNKDNTLDTTFIQSVSSPFADLELSLVDERVFAVTAVDNSNNQSWFSFATNSSPIFYSDISTATVEEDNSARLTFKVLDKDFDFLKVSAQIDESSTTLMDNSGLQVNKLGTDGDTTFFELILTPITDAYGQLDNIKILIEDGVNQIDTFLGPLVVNPVNEYKPIFDGESILVPSVLEDSGMNLSDGNLYSAITATDEDGDIIKYILSESVSGILTGYYQGKGTIELAIGDTLSNAEWLHWKAPADENGVLDGFRIRATDGELISDTELTVKFDVSSVNDVPIFEPLQIQLFEIEEEEKSFTITGLSPGVGENQGLTLSYQYGPYYLKNSDFDFEFSEDQSSAIVTVNYPFDAPKNLKLYFKLSDGEDYIDIPVNLIYYSKSQPPLIISEPEKSAYVDEPYNYRPEVDETGVGIFSVSTDLTLPSESFKEGVYLYAGGFVNDDADGVPLSARFRAISGMTFDQFGNLYIADTNAGKVKVVSKEGYVKTVIGDGLRTNREGKGILASLDIISDIEFDKAGNLYITDRGDDRVMKMGEDLNVERFLGIDGFKWEDGPRIETGIDDPIDIVFLSDGTMYVLGSGSFRRIKDEQVTELFSYTKNPEFNFDINRRMAVNSRNEIILSDIHSNKLLKIYNEQVTTIDLPNFEVRSYDIDFLNDDTVVFIDSNQGKVYTFDLVNEELKLVIGGGETDYFLGIDPNQLKTIPTSVAVYNSDIYFSDNKGGIYVLKPNVERIAFTPAKEDIGAHDFQLRISSLYGKESLQNFTLDIKPSDKVDASNLNQTVVYNEDEIVDFTDIVISGTAVEELIEVSLTLDSPSHGELSVDSGNGEFYQKESGKWKITGTTSEVNAALASVTFEPSHNLDRDSRIAVKIIRENGVIPNQGRIELKVTPVNDLLELDPLPPGIAYAEIPYHHEFKFKDFDDYRFGWNVLEKPEWLSMESSVLVSPYTGRRDVFFTQDGDSDNATFEYPKDLMRRSDGNILVLDQYTVRKIQLGGSVSTFAGSTFGDVDGNGKQAQMGRLSGLTEDNYGNIYVGDNEFKKIKRIDPNGNVATIAGKNVAWSQNGWNVDFAFDNILDLAMSPEGSLLVLHGGYLWTIDEIKPDGGKVTLLKDKGYQRPNEGTFDEFGQNNISTIEFDKNGNLLLGGEAAIYRANLSTRQIEIIAGNGDPEIRDGLAKEGSIKEVNDITEDDYGNLYFTDDHTVRVLTIEGVLETLAGGMNAGYENGLGSAARFYKAAGIVDTKDGTLIVSDYYQANVRKVEYQKIIASGVPTNSNVGTENLKIQFSEKGVETILLDTQIEVQNDQIPVLTGMGQTYSGVEDDSEIVIDGISLSEVPSDEIELTFVLDKPTAGVFSGDWQNTEAGAIQIYGTQESLNTVLSSLHFYPNEHFNGALQVTVKAKRKDGLFDREGEFTLRLNPVNDTPVLDLSEVDAMVNLPIELPLTVSDVDFDPTDLKIENLPEWLTLNKTLKFDASTIFKLKMDIGSYSNIIRDGDVSSATSTLNMRSAVEDDYGNYYFIDGKSIRHFDGKDVKTLYSIDQSNEFRLTEMYKIRVSNNQIFISDAKRIFKLEEGGLSLFAGAMNKFLFEDIDGLGTEARFKGIGDFVSDGNGGLFVADTEAFKIKHIDPHGNVLTYAGGLSGSIDGPLANSGFDRILSLKRTTSGDLIVLEHPRGKTRRLRNGNVETVLPTDESPEYIINSGVFHTDDIGNLIMMRRFGLDVYDSNGAIILYKNVLNSHKDGNESVMGWKEVNDIVSLTGGAFIFTDASSSAVRLVKYRFDYVLTGTPPEGSEGTTNLTFKMNDGFGEEVTYQIPLNVASPDNPKVTGFPQNFSYIEDATPFPLDPITIESQDDSKEFKVRIDLGGERFGSLISSSFDLSNSLHSGFYEIKGNAAELNEILSTINYQPGLNNDLNSSIDFNFIQIGGNLSSDFKIPLSVTGVNDAPQIRSLSDTVAFVGDSINVLLDIFDFEDGKDVSLTNIVKPDWLKIQKAEIQSEIIAGTLGMRGAKLGDAQSSILTQPQYVAEDDQKNLYISDRSLNSIFKLDQNGQLTLYAGSLRSGNVDGFRDKAQFYNPSGLAVDSDGTMYIADSYNNLIKKISSDGEVTTIAGSGRKETWDGGAQYAAFNNPTTLALSEEKGLLYIGEGRYVRVLDLQSKMVSTLPIQLEEDALRSLSLAKNGDILFGSFNYVARYTYDGQLIRIIGSGNYGNQDGDYTVASFSSVESIAEDDKGNIFIYDQFGTVLRKISKDLQVSTLTEIGNPLGFNSRGNLLMRDNELIFAESGNNVVRRVKLDQYFISGRPSVSDLGENNIQATIKDTEDLETNFDFKVLVKANDRPNVLGQDTLLLFGEKDGTVELQKFEIVDSNDNSFEVFISPMNSSSISIGTTSTELIPFDNEKKGWILQGKTADLNSQLGSLKGFSDSFEDETLKFRFSKAGGELDTVKTVILVPKPVNDLPVLTTQNVIEVVAGEEFNLSFEGTDPDKDVLTYTSSNWPTWVQADSVRMLQSFIDLAYSKNLPDSVKNKVSISGMAINQSGDIYTVSSSRNKVYKLLSNGEFELYAGNGNSGYEDGSRLEAEFYRPRSILFDKDNNLIVGDLYNTALRKIGSDGIVSTLVGGDRVLSSFNFTGRNGYKDEAKPFWIGRLAKDDIGNIYTSEYFSVGKFDLSGYYKTIAGKPGYNYDGYVDGSALDARFLYSTAIVPLQEDSLLIWDDSAGKLRRLSNGYVETISGADGFGYHDGNIKNARYGGFSASILLKSGEILVMDVMNYTLRVLDFKEDKVSTIAGKGYFGSDFGLAEEVALGSILDLLELENGDILLSESSKIKRLAYSTPKISGTPQLSDVGEHKFTLRISDGKDGIIEEEIIIKVIAPNTLPTVTTIPNVGETFATGKTKNVALFDYFADAENSDSELTYEVVTNSDNSVVTTSAINSADGLLRLSVANAGTTTLTLKATDTRGGSVTTSFEVNIAKAEATIEFGTLSFINTGEAKPVTVTTVPSGLNFTLTYAGQTSAPSTVGTYALEAVIDERNYAKVATAELAIINIAPEAMALSANTIFENSAEATLIGELSVTDQNPTDTHQYSLPTGTTDNGSFTITDAKLYASSSFNFEEKASYTVTVLVTDNHNATYQKEFMVTVTDVNEVPTIDAYAEIQVVKNLGSLSITLTGLSAGEDANQTITITSAKSGVIKSNSVTLSADKTTALLTFETETDQEGTGTIQVTVQDDGGTANGGVDTKTIDIPIKVLAPNVTVTNGSNCGPGSVSLSAAGADSYKWYAAPLGGSSLSSEATYTVDLQTSSTFYVAGVVSGTESKLRVPVSATVFDALAAPVITNTDNVLSVTAVTGLSYQWMKDGVNIDEATANSFSPTESGNYSVVISNTNNCSATSVAEEVIITGIEGQMYTLAVTVYPVPSSDYVYLEFDETLRKGTKVQMVDNLGKQLLMQLLTEATNKLTIDVRKMPEGVHTIVVQDGAKLARKKILIQR